MAKLNPIWVQKAGFIMICPFFHHKWPSWAIFYFMHCFWPSWEAVQPFHTQDYHASFYFRKPLMPDRRKPSRGWRQPSGAFHRKGRTVGGPFWVRAEPSSSGLEDAFYSWAKVLGDCGVSLSLTAQTCQRWVVLVYFALLKPSILMLYNITPQLFVLKWSSLRFSLNLFSFLNLQVLRKLKRPTACLEWEGLQELEMALMATPVSQLVDLVAAWVHGADESSPSSGAPSPSAERWWAPTPSEQAPKRAHHSPTATTLVAPKEDELTLMVVHLLSDSPEVITGSSGSSTLPMGLQKGPQSLATLLSWHSQPGPSVMSIWRAWARCTYVGSVP